MDNQIFEYAVAIRRQLHQYPEIGFDLPKTLALVRRELEEMDIPYTEEYGRSSIVGVINPDCKDFTIGIRGDMDALPMQEADLQNLTVPRFPDRCMLAVTMSIPQPSWQQPRS